MSGSGLRGDARARREALDVTRSFIVQAPAGSGKTELLIQRHLALLAIVEAPEEVVAITFTRKATGEMRGRLLEALARVDDPPPPNAHARQTHALARAVRRRDRDLGWLLRANPARLRIQTIDGLCARLARQMPWLSRFSAEAQPVEDAGPLYRETARRALALLEEDPPLAAPVSALLAHLDNDLERFETLLESMLARRDQWLRYLSRGKAGDSALRIELEAALARAVDESLQDLSRVVPEALADDIVALAAYAGANMDVSNPHSPIARLAGLNALPPPTHESLRLWQGLAALLLSGQGRYRKRMDKSVGIPSEKNEYAVKMKRRAEALTAAMAGETEFELLLGGVAAIPEPSYTEDQWRVLTALLEVLRIAAGLLRVVFAEAGRVDFIELLSAARLALGEGDSPTDLALSLDYRISHILVDEFQDTSHSQFQLLNQLTAGWTPDDGRTLFLVGDPMQSIYRFREADVGVFLRAWHKGFGHLRPQPLSLSANFRSVAGIVDWVNRVFPRVFPKRDDESGGAVAYRPAVAAGTNQDDDAVTLHSLIDGGRGEEARRVVDCVRDALAAAPTERVAVLVRSRSHLTDILPRLDAAGIAYRGVELRSVLSAPVVHDLLSLTRALIHPADRVAWLALLRAPWCGLLLEDLSAMAEGEGGRTVPELLADASTLDRLSTDGRARLERVAPVLLGALFERGRRPLRRQVEGVWQALGGPACVDRIGLEDAGICLDMIERYESEQRLVDPDALTARMAGLYATPKSADAPVEVMTIHKAKGLEFDTVIVPALERTPPAEEKRLLAWTQRAAGPTGTDLLLAPIPGNGTNEPPLYDYLKSVERAKQELEAARLVYVAATRARRRLHLIGAAVRHPSGRLKAPPKRALLRHLWPALAEGFAAARLADGPARADPPRQNSPTRTGLSRLPPGWSSPQPAPAVAPAPPLRAPSDGEPGEAVIFEWAGIGVRHAGSIVHELLRRIAEEGAQHWDEERVRATAPWVRRALAAYGLSGEELEPSVRTVLDALISVLADHRGQWILSAAHREAENEFALSGVLDGQLLNVYIDRTFIDTDGVRWIVDYKSGRHEGASTEAFLDREQARYASQLERYGRLMAGIDRRPIRVGLYFPLLRGWRAWTPDSEEKVE
ncbi:MAG TPA: UvrD-helicase domain-containing protein [Gammaproteobacteria bacterium]|nr:UvrD-helicase domain-containing protein [Gammaproteobacteria bacterium]